METFFGACFSLLTGIFHQLHNFMVTLQHFSIMEHTVGAKKKVSVQHCTFTVLERTCTYALLPPYFRHTLIILLLLPLMYCSCTTALLYPYRDTTIKDW